MSRGLGALVHTLRSPDLSMIRMTTKEVHDLKQSKLALEDILVTLDRAGAGIAAIHVNAAIEQLKKNLSSVRLDPTIISAEHLFVPEQNQ
ncbi:hypothetical protein INR77_09655 [Erythrobacter sp. SCSIO 43205]|uniref:hypothetical protein n=1 Tax=Erythrobacter sp. SCSIO 43205 TaxID=2779361 RepID=UPI001CA9D8A2|nr:hypothetical protein [Erythrobacter sp. SCSIO 43205]UAB77097.1 hypothetical protein INR77_09655 [Erythrobacter sp. SCSIO 43205]